jgi:hypothetical protein
MNKVIYAISNTIAITLCHYFPLFFFNLATNIPPQQLTDGLNLIVPLQLPSLHAIDVLSPFPASSISAF